MNHDGMDTDRTNNRINHNEGNSIGTNNTGHIEKMNAFLDRVVAPIPGLREKKIVREEMKSHIEDEAFELMEEGVNEEAAYVEAVSNMGDASELAYELMMVHQYDSNAGFNKMVWVLWIGIFLTWLPSINQLPGKFTGWIGIYLVVFALYRMRTISKEFKKAFYAAYIGGLAAPMALVSTVIPNAVLAYGIRVVAMLIFYIVGIVVMANFLERAVSSELDRQWEGTVWMLKMFICGKTIASLVISAVHGFPEEAINISVNDSFGFIIIIFFVAFVICDIIWIVQSWKVKSALIEESYAGVEPFSLRKMVKFLIPVVCVALLPVIISIAISIWPVQGSYYMEIQGADFNELSEEKQKERLLAILPEDEKAELGQYQILSFDKKEGYNWGISDGNPNVWLIRGGRQVPEIARSNQERIAIFSVWENPKAGFKAAGGFWVSGRYTMGDQVELTKNRSFFAYEKDGVLYEFQPSRVWEYDLKIAAEYALRSDADRVYCYQAFTDFNPVDEDMVVGYEVALQRSPIRIPYDDILVQNDGNGHLVMLVNNSGIINLLDYGNVRNQSTVTWIKVGGVAHFANEEGDDSYDSQEPIFIPPLDLSSGNGNTNTGTEPAESVNPFETQTAPTANPFETQPAPMVY